MKTGEQVEEHALLPCPFCGGPAEHEYLKSERSTAYWAECNKCGVKTDIALSPTEAAEWWNTRVTRPVPDADLVEAAKQWLEANTPLKWVTEAEVEKLCETIPIGTAEELNRRPQKWAERLASFALSVSQQWIPIRSVEDLPIGQPAFYLWWYREEEHREADLAFFDDGMNLPEFVRRYAAWMPIPPYMPKPQGGDSE